MVVTVDAVVYCEATDPVKLEQNVADLCVAAVKLAQADKVFLPLEVSGILGSIGGVAELFEEKGKTPPAPPDGS